MKFYYLYLVPFFFMSCKSAETSKAKPVCPDGYDCYTEILADKAIIILEDTIGKTYIKVKDNKAYNVIKYIYRYEGDPQISDDTYEENIYFQIPKNKKSIDLSGKSLSDVKLIIQKSCFCRDSGYELIQDGHLKVQKHQNTYSIKLDFQSKKQMKIDGLQTSLKF